jgi:hypothetical protein
LIEAGIARPKCVVALALLAKPGGAAAYCDKHC